MSKSLSTYERKMKDKQFRKAYKQSYSEQEEVKMNEFDEQLHNHSPLYTARFSIHQALHGYFAKYDPKTIPQGVYERVLSEIELPLLTAVMAFTRGNQVKATKMLGINRGTLRKKLKQYDIK